MTAQIYLDQQLVGNSEISPPAADKTPRTNHGYLLRINQKQSAKAPDMEGEAWIAGSHFNIAGWVNISKRGRKYLNLKFTPAS